MTQHKQVFKWAISTDLYSLREAHWDSVQEWADPEHLSTTGGGFQVSFMIYQSPKEKNWISFYTKNAQEEQLRDITHRHPLKIKH